MDYPEISKKDQIILQQLDVIRTMTDHNLSRVGTDFWGNPIQPLKVDAAKPAAPQDPGQPANGGTASSTGNDNTNAPKTEEAPPEKMEDLQRSWTAISA